MKLKMIVAAVVIAVIQVVSAAAQSGESALPEAAAQAGQMVKSARFAADEARVSAPAAVPGGPNVAEVFRVLSTNEKDVATLFNKLDIRVLSIGEWTAMHDVIKHCAQALDQLDKDMAASQAAGKTFDAVTALAKFKPVTDEMATFTEARMQAWGPLLSAHPHSEGEIGVVGLTVAFANEGRALLELRKLDPNGGMTPDLYASMLRLNDWMAASVEVIASGYEAADGPVSPRYHARMAEIASKTTALGPTP